MKMTQPLAALTAASLFLGLAASAADWPQWRGPARNGVSPETGLLPAWPAEGPTLVWKVAHAGSGYAAPAVVGNRVYLLGNEGLENEFVQALDAKNGQRLWATRLGAVGNPKQNPNFPAARSTPTVDGDALYALGSDGDLACLEAANGKVRWRKSLRAEFGGKPGEWAYAESPLVDGDTVLCTPGGAQATVLALDKRTGETRWRRATPEADEAGYASATVIELGGTRQYVQLLQKGLVGLDAKTGRLLWRFDRATSRYNANIPSPLADGDIIYCASAGTGGGAVRLTAAPGGVTLEQLYFEAKLPTAIGGAVKVGNWLFGTSSQTMLCADFVTGRIQWEERALGAGALIYADGRLYLHAENGQVALVEPTPEGYRERGRFTPPDRPRRISPMEKAWAYPALAAGRLYLRDHGLLWCYDVKAGS
jgi:outer membrane protein assembly factor BamB